MAIKETKKIPISEIKLNPKNPRLFDMSVTLDESPNFISPSDKRDITQEQAGDSLRRIIAADRTSKVSGSFEQLKRSIKQNKGIFQPIFVSELKDDNHFNYFVIEGNTRLFIYKQLADDGIDWATDIMCNVVDDPDSLDEIMSMAHIVGTKEWSPYAKAKYMSYLQVKNENKYKHILKLCGSQAEATKLKNNISAYQDMEDTKKFFDPKSDEFVPGGQNFTPQLFSFYDEYQKVKAKLGRVIDLDAFAKQVRVEKIVDSRHVKRLSKILTEDDPDEKWKGEFLNTDITSKVLISSFDAENLANQPDINDNQKLLNNIMQLGSIIQQKYTEPDDVRSLESEFIEIQAAIESLIQDLESLSRDIESYQDVEE